MDNTNDNHTTNPSEKPLLNSANCRRKGAKLEVYDWLSDIPESHDDTDLVEVRFKNTRKGYYRNTTHIRLVPGDLVAVEASPGHDIGEVTLTGRLVLLQMKKNNVKIDNPELKRVYRKAKPNDLEKFEEAKAKEHDTMIRARKIAEDLHLDMKIGDVEYQGDGNKAIFYYIADERVDFRQLIKVLAEVFRVRIEMKQIGARQEAGRIGGLGPCGRQLCCSGWMTNFVSVATSAARYQDIALNPQKLAGQCAKLKCCLNYEADAYVEAQKRLPSREIPLETKLNTYYHFKTDIFKREMTYSTDKSIAANLVTVSADRVFEVISLNKRGIKPDTLESEAGARAPERRDFEDVVGQDSLTRFDKAKKKKKGSGGKDNNGGNNNRRQQQAGESRNKSGNNGGGNNNGGNRSQNKPPRNGKKGGKDKEGNAQQSNAQQPRKEGSKEGNAQQSNAQQPRKEGSKEGNAQQSNAQQPRKEGGKEGNAQQSNAQQPRKEGGKEGGAPQPRREGGENAAPRPAAPKPAAPEKKE